MSIPVHAVATPLNTCRASRACRDERVAPCCPTSATQHVTIFSCAMHGLDSVSLRDETSGIWAIFAMKIIVQFWLIYIGLQIVVCAITLVRNKIVLHVPYQSCC